MSRHPIQPPPRQAGASKVLFLSLLAGLLVALIGIGIAIVLMLGNDNGNDADPTPAVVEVLPPQYHRLTPAFTVNLADPGGMRYMQADVELMTRDPAVLAALENHQPLIRNRLLLLFGEQFVDDLRTRADRERLQDAALAEVAQVLADAGVDGAVEAVYFTSFVTQ
ncbi:MAG: flagellar basal body-associated FliL family protein [Lysobacteraceae bacterium]